MFPSNPLRPIEHVDIYLAVRGSLERLIATFEAGERLPSERELAESLGVSRTVVREALKVLQYMGKIEISRGAGIFVLRPSPDLVAQRVLAGREIDMRFLLELAEARAAVEVKILEGALDGATPDRWDELEDILTRDAENLDRDGRRESLNLLFEAGIGRAVGNPVLASTQSTVHELWIESWDRLGLSPGDRRRLHGEHLEILDALQRCDRDQAASLMRRHVTRSLDAAVAAGDPLEEEG